VDLLKLLFGPPLPAVTPQEAQARLKSRPAPYVLDVRQPAEYAEGHIAGATLIPLNQLADRLRDLPRDREILCVCRSGSRSGSAVRRLVRDGYNAVNLRGGMSAWQAAGLPVKKGSVR